MTDITPLSDAPTISIAALRGSQEPFRSSAVAARAHRRTARSGTLEQIERLPIAAYICDASGVVTDYNTGAAELWGLGNGEERFCGAHRVYLPDGTELPRDHTPLAQVLATGEAVTDVELMIERPDGARATVLLNAAPLFGEAGTVSGAVCCAQDVTNWKRLTELRYRSQKLEALGQLTANVAHDFSNLLATITLNVNLIGKRVSDPGILKFLRSTRRVIERGSLLTGQLLACAGRQKLNPQRSDLNAVIRAMHDVLRQAMGPAVRLEILCAEDLWPALADAEQVELAILSLAANARSAMYEGGQLVIQTGNRRLEARQAELPAGDYVVISIMDDGEGMSEEVLARAFDPFFATPGAGRRAGLGLSMVMGMAQQHGGTVHIDSRVGQGTKVDIYLPRAEAAQRPTDKATKAGAADATVPEPRVGQNQSRTILVVDDDPDLRLVAVDALRGMGYHVLHAESGEAALEVLRDARPIELLVVDYSMAGMNGLELVHHARTLRPSLKVLVITGHLNAPGLVAAAQGSLAVLRKPFRASDFEARIKALLDPVAPLLHRSTARHRCIPSAP